MAERLVLLVEDEDVALSFARFAFRKASPHTRVEVARDGEAALARLRDVASPLPELVVLDLLLPRLDGWGVLYAMRTDPRLADVPVVILTSSKSPIDARTAVRMGAQAFHTKPTTLADFHTLALALSAHAPVPPDRPPQGSA